MRSKGKVDDVLVIVLLVMDGLPSVCGADDDDDDDVTVTALARTV